MKFTQGQYQKVIADLRAAAGQLEPDGHCCAICDDTDHQAWECHHNPLNWKELAVDLQGIIDDMLAKLKTTSFRW